MIKLRFSSFYTNTIGCTNCKQWDKSTERVWSVVFHYSTEFTSYFTEVEIKGDGWPFNSRLKMGQSSMIRYIFGVVRKWSFLGNTWHTNLVPDQTIWPGMSTTYFLTTIWSQATLSVDNLSRSNPSNSNQCAWGLPLRISLGDLPLLQERRLRKKWVWFK